MNLLIDIEKPYLIILIIILLLLIYSITYIENFNNIKRCLITDILFPTKYSKWRFYFFI